jgi:DNA-binding LytR/AlgR family response regulator
MNAEALKDIHVLVVEDEFLLADDLSKMLQAQGAVVIGPVPTIDQANSLLGDALDIDAAILDVNLRDTLVYPVAERLKRLAVPFVFTTGYDQAVIPSEYRHTPRLYKPYDMTDVLVSLVDLLKSET